MNWLTMKKNSKLLRINFKWFPLISKSKFKSKLIKALQSSTNKLTAEKWRFRICKINIINSSRFYWRKVNSRRPIWINSKVPLLQIKAKFIKEQLKWMQHYSFRNSLRILLKFKMFCRIWMMDKSSDEINNKLTKTSLTEDSKRLKQ